MKTDFDSLYIQVLDAASKPQALQNICELLQTAIQHYNWVGFYMMNDHEQLLTLGPYAGAATDHTRIPYGRGICGQVAVNGETFVVPDVWQQDNYLACSLETKAEIVIPIYYEGKLIAQLDIDSHYIDPFTQDDEDFLNRVCLICAPLLATTV